MSSPKKFELFEINKKTIKEIRNIDFKHTKPKVIKISLKGTKISKNNSKEMMAFKELIKNVENYLLCAFSCYSENENDSGFDPSDHYYVYNPESELETLEISHCENIENHNIDDFLSKLLQAILLKETQLNSIIATNNQLKKFPTDIPDASARWNSSDMINITYPSLESNTDSLSKNKGLVSKVLSKVHKLKKRSHCRDTNQNPSKHDSIPYFPYCRFLILYIHTLNLSHNKIPHLPQNICSQLSKFQLKNLYLSHNELQDLPDLDNNNNINQLHIDNNKIKNLPNSLGNLTNLEELNIQHNKLGILPNSFGNLTNLKKLDISYNEIVNLPNSFGNLTNLEELWLSNNKLQSLPQSFQGLQNLKKLYLANNRLTIADIPIIVATGQKQEIIILINNNINHTQIQNIQATYPNWGAILKLKF